MSVPDIEGSVVAGDVRATPTGAFRAVLPYGEVRVGPDQLVVGFESLAHVSPVQRQLYEQAVAAVGVDPDDVLVVRVNEASIEVDAIDADHECWPVRTLHLAAGAARRHIGGGGGAVGRRAAYASVITG